MRLAGITVGRYRITGPETTGITANTGRTPSLYGLYGRRLTSQRGQHILQPYG